MEQSLKRVSLMLKEEQSKILSKRGLNISGLVRDLLDDYLSEHKITISVSQETRELYDKIISNTGSSDDEIEIYLKAALGELLKQKIRDMQQLQKDTFDR